MFVNDIYEANILKVPHWNNYSYIPMQMMLLFQPEFKQNKDKEVKGVPNMRNIRRCRHNQQINIEENFLHLQ